MGELVDGRSVGEPVDGYCVGESVEGRNVGENVEGRSVGELVFCTAQSSRTQRPRGFRQRSRHCHRTVLSSSGTPATDLESRAEGSRGRQRERPSGRLGGWERRLLHIRARSRLALLDCMIAPPLPRICVSLFCMQHRPDCRRTWLEYPGVSWSTYPGQGIPAAARRWEAAVRCSPDRSARPSRLRVPRKAAARAHW